MRRAGAFPSRRPPIPDHATSPTRALALRLGDPGGRIALIDGEAEISYRELAAEVERLAAGLHDDVGPGERLLIWLPNGPELLALLLACLRSGVVPVPLHEGITGAELPPLLSPLRARALAASPELLDRHAPVLARIDVGRVYRVERRGGAGVSPPYGGLLRSARAAGSPAAAEEACLILHTSGSKGRPKGVVLARRSLDSILAYRLANTELGPGCVSVVASCLTQSVGLYQSLAMLAAGGTIVQQGGYDAERMAELVNRYRPSHLIMVVEAFDRLLHHPKTTSDGLSRLRFGAVGADRVTPRVQRRAIALTGRPLRVSYGLTESSWALVNPGDRLDKCLALGQPTPGVDVSLRDADGQEVASGEVGEIWIRSPRTMRGYWDDAVQTREAIVDGWLASGDLAHRDVDGYLWFAGRKKNLIVLPSGDNVSPLEVEDVLRDHPSVAQAIVVGVGMPDGTERPWAFVVPADSRARDAQIETFLRERLSAPKIPQRILLLDEMPLGLTGKIQRDDVARLVASARS